MKSRSKWSPDPDKTLIGRAKRAFIHTYRVEPVVNWPVNELVGELQSPLLVLFGQKSLFGCNPGEKAAFANAF